MKRRLALVLYIFVIASTLQGCQTNPQKQVLSSNESQVKLRGIQTRAFSSNDKNKVMRSVISTMQDLDFVLDNADMILGTVSGTKFGRNENNGLYQLKMTVTVRPKNNTQMLVRSNAQYNIQAIEDPKPYQDFFAALEKSLFLTAQNVD